MSHPRPRPAAVTARGVIEARARSIVDYALARRSTLAGLADGRTSLFEVCDAQAYLLRAARYHGHRTDERCPVCGHVGLVQVAYTFGDCFRGDTNGRARPARELLALADEVPEFTAYVVEVCVECRWNHLVSACVLGTGEPVKRRAPRAEQRRAPRAEQGRAPRAEERRAPRAEERRARS